MYLIQEDIEKTTQRNVPPLTPVASKDRAASEACGHARQNVTVFIIREREISKVFGEEGEGEGG